MKLVLDSIIFISAFYWGGKPQKILDRVVLGLDELYITNAIFDEIAEVMLRPNFKTPPQIIDAYIKAIEKTGKKIFMSGEITGICRDKDDDAIIECGILSSADYLITGDNDLLVLEKYQGMKILSANEYLHIIHEESCEIPTGGKK